jgi:glucose dehydrogenase
MQESMKGGREYGSQTGAPYGMFRAPLFSPDHVPCSPPPWGTLTAVDMAEGKIRWQVPLGLMQSFGVAHTRPVPPGSPSLGGPIVTASGLVFIAGTLDPIIRAFDTETGKELWKAPTSDQRSRGAHYLSGIAESEAVRRNRRWWPRQNQRRTVGRLAGGVHVAIECDTAIQ